MRKIDPSFAHNDQTPLHYFITRCKCIWGKTWRKVL